MMWCAQANTIKSPKDNPRRLSYEAFMHDRQSGFSAHGWSGQTVLTSDDTKSLFSEVGQLDIPDGSIGCYTTFCAPADWSSAFSSPGQYTIKLVSASMDGGSIVYQFALLCGWIKSKKGGISRGEFNQRLSSYVTCIRRTEVAVFEFAEAMALRFPGHNLMGKLPLIKHFALPYWSSSLMDRGIVILHFFTYLLQITEVGHNRLVILDECVSRHLIVRTFLELPIPCDGDFNLSSTSSCSGRIEQQRPQLPTIWFDPLTPSTDGRKTQSFSYPRRDVCDLSSTLSALESQCTSFCPPKMWNRYHTDHNAFTVEISSISISTGYANFVISVLYKEHGVTVVKNVERRYKEFYDLAWTLDAKLSGKNIFGLIPPKTLWRNLSAAFLEQRSLQLQVFLENLMNIKFTGMLGQEIQMAAEPSARTFLGLPPISWTLIPAHQSGSYDSREAASTVTASLSPSQSSVCSPMFSQTPPANPGKKNRLVRRLSGSF